MKPVVIDADIVIRYLDVSHENHEAGLQAVERLLDRFVVIHPLTLAEVLVGAIRANDETGALADIRESIGASVYQEEAAPEVWARRLAQTRFSAKPQLRTPDAVVLDTAIQIGGLVATFDQRLSAAAKDAGVLFIV